MERKATSDSRRTIVEIGRTRFGRDPLPVIAGPCAIESEQQISAVAETVAEAGGAMLRGGAYKTSSTPYGFKGLGRDGVKLLAAAGARAGLPVATQVMEAADAIDARSEEHTSE